MPIFLKAANYKGNMFYRGAIIAAGYALLVAQNGLF